MSWTGFKKAINRAGNQVMLKTGQYDLSSDLEFDYQEKRFRTMEKASLRLHKELRNYKDSLRTVAHAQASVADVLAGFYGSEKNVASVYKDTTAELVACGDELETPYLQTVLNPIERFNLYYVDVNEAIKRRARKKVDYDALQAKVKKLADSEDPEKLHSAQEEFAQAQQVYGEINTQLKDELPQLIEMRIPYLNPLFEAFVKIQLRYFSDTYDRLNSMYEQLDAKTRVDYQSGDLDKKMDSILDKIRDLNTAL